MLSRKVLRMNQQDREIIVNLIRTTHDQYLEYCFNDLIDRDRRRQDDNQAYSYQVELLTKENDRLSGIVTRLQYRLTTLQRRLLSVRLAISDCMAAILTKDV